jgi:small subunit ribosomal protein S4
MARYHGPVCKLCRREGEKLFLKGARCLSNKCSFERRSYPPGEHGRDTQFRRGRASDFALQLREKQKARRIYGVLERQFRRYFREAQSKSGLTGSNLLIILESRLDNVVYRLGLADSRNHARQLVQHGHFTVNGVKMGVPSYQVRPGDLIEVREGSRKRKYFREIQPYIEARPAAPEWLSLETNAVKATVVRLPERREIDSPIREQLIVEYYSAR